MKKKKSSSKITLIFSTHNEYYTFKNQKGVFQKPYVYRQAGDK